LTPGLLIHAAEFASMAERVGRLKGRFIQSLNSRPQARKIFRRLLDRGGRDALRPTVGRQPAGRRGDHHRRRM